MVVGNERTGRLAERAVSVVGDPRAFQQFHGGTKLPYPGAFQRDIDERLGLELAMLRLESSGEVQGPYVERIQSQRLCQQAFCLVRTAKATKQHNA